MTTPPTNSEVPLSPSQLARRPQAARQFIVNGVLWLIYELPPSSVDRPHGASLIFESEFAVRRVRNYPGNWRELTNEGLLALSWET